MFNMGASYSLDFSTVLRTVKNADMSVELLEADTDGRNPLAPYLAKAKIQLNHSNAKTKFSTTTERKASARSASPLLNSTVDQASQSRAPRQLVQRQTL